MLTFSSRGRPSTRLMVSPRTRLPLPAASRTSTASYRVGSIPPRLVPSLNWWPPCSPSTRGDYQWGLDQLSGSQFAQSLQSVLWSLSPLNASITDRMDCSLNVLAGGRATRQPCGQATRPCIRPGQVQAWARAFGGWNNLNGDVNAPGFDEDQFGIWAGIDYGWGDVVVAGVAGGCFWSDMDFDQFGGVWRLGRL